VEESSSSGEGQRDASVCRSDAQRFRLTKADRIRQSSDFRRIMRKGARYFTPHFHIRMLRNPLGITRLGITAGRKAGNACARNRIKRRLREYFRLNRDKMPSGTDIVFIASQEATTLETGQVFEELNRFFDTRF
jgi:ribonuclease P protein component